MSNRNPDTLPTLADPSGQCPRCGRISNFNASAGTMWWLVRAMKARKPPMPDSVGDERAVWLKCMGCGDCTVVFERYVSNTDGWVGQHWWPVPGVGALDPDVPDAVVSAYDEGSRCLAIHGTALRP